MDLIWEAAKDPGGATMLTFVLVATPPNDLVGRVADRMPAVIQPEHRSTSLNQDSAFPKEAKAPLRPYAGDLDMALE
jgi:putative SOS response-associated peptidase YedK